MVTAGEVEGRVALHALEADEDIDDGIVQRVPQVQLPGDVGGRDDDGKRDLVLVYFRAEVAPSIHSL